MVLSRNAFTSRVREEIALRDNAKRLIRFITYSYLQLSAQLRIEFVFLTSSDQRSIHVDAQSDQRKPDESMCTNLGLLQKKLCFTVICWSGRTRFVRFLLVELRYSFYTFNRVQEEGTKMGKPGIQADMRFVSQSVSWLLFLHKRLDLCLCHAIRPTVVIMSFGRTLFVRFLFR